MVVFRLCDGGAAAASVCNQSVSIFFSLSTPLEQKDEESSSYS